jgi:hypothetical protein
MKYIKCDRCGQQIGNFDDNCEIEISFFGGSFTGIDLAEQNMYLDVANEFFYDSRVKGIRLSTRPDYINDSILTNLKEKGVTIPFISLGKNGAAAMIDNKYYHFKIPSVPVVNCVGSGDSTVAGIAVGICRRLPIIDAIRLGMATGVANTQFQQTGFVTTNLAQNFYKQIEVVEL